MITRKMNKRFGPKIYHANVNVNLMEENTIQSGTTINVDASAKNIIHLKNIIFGILLHVVLEIENI